MREIYKGVEALARVEGETAYRLCLLLTGRPRTAERAAFQGFLYLAQTQETLSPEDERRQLYRFLLRAAEDELYRKGGVPLKRSAFEELAGATVSDGLWRLMRRPFQFKAAAYLVRGARFSPEDAASVLGVHRERVEKWLAAGDGAEDAYTELQAFEPSPAWAEQLDDNLLMRWQERNVPFENGLLRFRSAADRLVPYLALAAVLLCLAAVWYTARLSASLGG